MCSALADVCDRALVQCVTANPDYPDFLMITNPAYEPYWTVLEWAALADKCNLQTFASCCEMYVINNFPLVSWSRPLKCSVASYCAKSG